MNAKQKTANNLLYLIGLIGVLPAVIYLVKWLLGLDVRTVDDIVHLTITPIIFALLFVAGLYLCIVLEDFKKVILLLPLLTMAVIPVLSTSDPDKMPRGAVVAFNLPEGCPENWVPFSPANGRMVIGAFNESPGSEVASKLTKRKLLDEGGAEKHKLSRTEMPSHTHGNGGYKYLLAKTGSGTYKGGSDKDKLKREPNLFYARSLVKVGGNLPHNNMPPFIALYYCQKM